MRRNRRLRWSWRVLPVMNMIVLSVMVAASACDDAGVTSGSWSDYQSVVDTTAADANTAEVATPDMLFQADQGSAGDVPMESIGDLSFHELTFGDISQLDAVDASLQDSFVPDTFVTPDQDMTQDQTGAGYISQAPPYGQGELSVSKYEIAAGDDGAPVDMILFAPSEPGVYPLVIFQHGFMMANSYYSTILSHIASHGFVVAAPQMYPPGGLPFGKPSTPEEVAVARQVLDWLSGVVDSLSGVTADTTALALAGHSRGGKVIWSLLKDDPTVAVAVAGVDPVDGKGGPLGGEQKVIQGPFGLNIPSLIIGTGYGPQSSGVFSQPCAPEGDNHEDFYVASSSPAWHVVATEQGHNDMLDAEVPGCGMICTACVQGDDKQGMRTFTAGQLTAFFILTLQGGDPGVVLNDPSVAPISAVFTIK